MLAHDIERLAAFLTTLADEHQVSIHLLRIAPDKSHTEISVKPEHVFEYPQPDIEQPPEY